MDDSVRRAYATLGLAPGASPPDVKRQYKALVRKWHPDRFLADPTGQAEAAQRMRDINQAYHVVLEAQAAGPARPRPASSASAAPPPRPRTPSGRLSPDEIDGICDAIGTESPVDSLLSFFPPLRYRWVGIDMLAYGIGLFIVALASAWMGSRFAQVVVLIVLSTAAVLGFLALRERKKRSTSK